MYKAALSLIYSLKPICEKKPVSVMYPSKTEKKVLVKEIVNTNSAATNIEVQIPRPGMVDHACNPSFWEAEVRRSFEVRSLRPT